MSGCELITIRFVAQGGNVSKYIIRSISGMNIDVFEVAVARNCVAIDCMYRQIVQTTGSYYKVTISSVNDEGVGPESNPVQGMSCHVNHVKQPSISLLSKPMILVIVMKYQVIFIAPISKDNLW